VSEAWKEGGREGGREGRTVLGQADGLGVHNLVGGFVLQHAVLVDATLMGKGVGTDDSLVGLDDLREGRGREGGMEGGMRVLGNRGMEGEDEKQHLVIPCFLLCLLFLPPSVPPSLRTMPVNVETRRDVL